MMKRALLLVCLLVTAIIFGATETASLQAQDLPPTPLSPVNS